MNLLSFWFSLSKNIDIFTDMPWFYADVPKQESEFDIKFFEFQTKSSTSYFRCFKKIFVGK